MGAPNDEESMVRSAAFRLLLTRGEPVAPEDLAGPARVAPERLSELLEQLARAGRIRRDREGRVTGSAGLSVMPDRHQIDLDGRRFWTWCAYDFLGIFGALQASGSALTRSPVTGRPLEVAFHRGRPEAAGYVLFRPDDSLAAGCSNAYEQWCPNSNLLEDREAALAWSAEHGVPGQVLTLDEAADIGTRAWQSLLEEA